MEVLDNVNRFLGDDLKRSIIPGARVAIVAFSALIITALSVGFDATHPLMPSITTSLDPKHRGQITGLATFANFIGMAIGALVFRRLMAPRFSTALVCFACTEFCVGVLALYAFRGGSSSHQIASESATWLALCCERRKKGFYAMH